MLKALFLEMSISRISGRDSPHYSLSLMPHVLVLWIPHYSIAIKSVWIVAHTYVLVPSFEQDSRRRPSSEGLTNTFVGAFVARRYSGLCVFAVFYMFDDVLLRCVIAKCRACNSRRSASVHLHHFKSVRNTVAALEV